MTTTIRARGPRDLLAYLPYRFGYRPADSIVLVGLRSPRGRVGLVVRADIADLADVVEGPRAARAFVAHLVCDGADRALLVAYTDAPLRAGGPAAARERAAVEHVREAVDECLTRVDTWVVSSTGYGALDCTDVSCCPPGGRDLDDLRASEVSAHMVLAGVWAANSREEALRIPQAEASARKQSSSAAARWRRRLDAARGADGALRAVRARWATESLAAWRHAVAKASRTASVARGEYVMMGPGQSPSPGAAGGALPATLLGRIEAGLEIVAVRDAVLVSLVPGHGDLAEAVARGTASHEATGRAVASIVDPRAAREPDEDGLRAAEFVLTAVVAHAVGSRQAPALTLLALTAWWRGDGGRATVRIEEALAREPTYRLALLLRDAVGAGVPPGWARSGREEVGDVG